MKHFPFLPMEKREEWMDAQGKRHDVRMPRLGTCIASRVHTLTLCARRVLHSSNYTNIPLILVLTCAEK